MGVAYWPNPVATIPLAATDIADGSVSDAEFQRLDGVTSAIQTQLDAKLPTVYDLRKSITTPVLNATDTMADLTALSVTLVAGHTYAGSLVVKCSNSTAAEGISIDFGGGTATMTGFAAGATVITGGTTVAVTTVSSALGTDLNWTTITGETWIAIEIGLTVNAGGTFIPRFCEGTAHTSGTTTVSAGTYLSLQDRA